MNKIFTISSILIFFISACCNHGDTRLPATLVSITDGDTVKVLLFKDRKFTIRLYGIDAPEKDQPYGAISTQNLERLCQYNFKHEVDIFTVDKYSRLVAVLYCNGVNVNLKQVENGLAWSYYTNDYQEAEQTARASGVGLWSAPEQVPPWEWRKK